MFSLVTGLHQDYGAGRKTDYDFFFVFCNLVADAQAIVRRKRMVSKRIPCALYVKSKDLFAQREHGKIRPICFILADMRITAPDQADHILAVHNLCIHPCLVWVDCLEDRGLSGITAFVGNNDMVAYGIMDAVLKKGYKIPRDFSVCSFDNDFPSGLLPVSLTTVEHYMEEKGRKAFDTIYQKIQWNETPEQKSQYFIRIEYKPYLIVRDSTNRARQQKR